MRKFTTKEQKVLEQLLNDYVSEPDYEKCIACMVMECWDIPKEDQHYLTYEKKQKAIVNHLKTQLTKIKDEKRGIFSNLPDGVKLRLRAVNKCKEHASFRKYKILANKADYIIYSNLMNHQLEGRVNMTNKINSEAVLRFPVLSPQLREVKLTVTMLLSAKGGK